MTVYEEFLRLLDFSEEELPAQLPRWKTACDFLGLTERDISFAMHEWIPVYWDLRLHGVRKCIGAYIRELIEMTRLSEYKDRGDKILYYNMPIHPACIYANKLRGGDRVHISYPDYIVATVFNAFFHKGVQPDEKNASLRSPICHQCGMNRIKANDYFRKIIAEPTVLWNWGLYCNEGHKTEELLQNLSDRQWNQVLTTIPKDALSDVPETQDGARVEYLTEQLKFGQSQISEYTGVQVTDEDVVMAVEEYLAYLSKVERLMDRMSVADPQPITGNDLAIFYAPSQIAFDTGFKYLNDAIDCMILETEERIAGEEGPLPKHAPRLACQFVPFSVPWINKAFVDSGVNLSINTFFALASAQRRHFDRDNIYKSIALQWLSNPSAVNMQNEVELVCEILEKYPQDGVLYGFFDFGCWIGSLQKTMIKMVEEKTGIPHYYFESEFWDDARYSIEDRITRIQNISYKVKINHMISGHKHAKK